jgi:hypothetical protein
MQVQSVCHDTLPRLISFSLDQPTRMKTPRLFLSHSWKDKFFVNKLAEQLAARGVEVWVDSAELRVGD